MSTFRITATSGIKNGAAQWWRSHSTVRRRRCLCADVPISPISSPHAWRQRPSVTLALGGPICVLYAGTAEPDAAKGKWIRIIVTFPPGSPSSSQVFCSNTVSAFLYDGWLHYTLRFCLIKAVNNIEKAYVVVQNIIFTFLCEYRGQNNIHLLSPLHDIVVCIVRLQELKFNDRAEKRIQERTHKQCKLRLSKRGFV